MGIATVQVGAVSFFPIKENLTHIL